MAAGTAREPLPGGHHHEKGNPTMITALALFFGLYVGFFLFVFGVAELLERASR